MSENHKKLSCIEKLGYGFGDGGCNIIWQTIMLFMTYFYTDIYGLSAVHMGIMFLVVRVLDAVFDIAMGFIADRTRSSFGQFRPYLLWFSIPFGVMGALAFYTPDFSGHGKIIYAYVTYTLLSFLYSAVNVPYCAMVNNLSKNPKERVSLQAYRFAFASLGGLIVSTVAMPLIKILGNGSNQQGYFYAMVVMASISVLMLLLCFFWSKERYIPDPVMKGQTPVAKAMLADLRLLITHGDWVRLCSLNVITLVAGILKTGMAIYFVTYYLEQPELISAILAIILVAKFVGSMLSTRVFKNVDRVLGYKYAMTLQALLMMGLFFIDAKHLWLICVLISLVHIINASATPLQWSLLSDVIDDIEKSSKRNLSGLVFSTNLFAIKVGIALGGALIGWALASSGYVGKAPAQSEEALLCIRLLFTVVPALLLLCLPWVLRNYALTDQNIQKKSNSPVLAMADSLEH